jgi:hypothetical protein
MHDRVQALARRFVAKDDGPQDAPIDRPGGVQNPGTEGRDHAGIRRSTGGHHLVRHHVEVEGMETPIGEPT